MINAIGTYIGSRFPMGIFSAYAKRVTEDGGVAEAGSCVNAVSGISLNSSLLLVPSGYKASKLYSEVPTSGDGDLSFTRSNDTATRVNSAGLIEKVRTNLNTYSEDFSGVGGWAALFGATITATANYGTAPDGTTTSTRIVFSGGSQIYSKTISGISGNIGVLSLWIKGTVGETIAITYGGASDKLVTLGSGWTRFTTNGNSASNNTIYINTFLSATARDFEVWGGQVEFGDIATDYIPTTSAAVSVGPVANVPRLDYTGGGCPSLLLEKQSTNLFNYSEQFDNGYWTKSGSAAASAPVVTANYAISPDGYQNADRVYFDAVGTSSADRSSLVRNFAFTTGETYTISGYAKSATGANQILQFRIAGAQVGGELTATNEWQRFSVTHTATASTTDNFGIQLRGNNTETTSDLLLYGLQLESATYATSYIPTLAAASTRGQDACSKTGISSLIGQTEGTLFLETSIFKGGATSVISLSDNSTSNRVIIGYIGSSQTLYAQSIGGASAPPLMSFNVSDISENHKMAVKYKANDFALWVDGVEVDSESSGTVPAVLNKISFDSGTGSSPLYGNVKQVLIFPSALSDTELADLTTI